jgi:hypothetical protein
MLLLHKLSVILGAWAAEERHFSYIFICGSFEDVNSSLDGIVLNVGMMSE